MINYCTRCRLENYDTSKFCADCGTELCQTDDSPSSTHGVLDRRYEIIETVKSGAMGRIYKALDRRLRETVAVKEMNPSFDGPPERREAEERFEAEARLLFTLHHSGLPKVSDFFTGRGPFTIETYHYLVMTFIDGPDLERIIQQRGRFPFPVNEVLNYSRQIADILDYLHTRNPPIIHRDLNPRNITVQEGKVFLVDFGIAGFYTPEQLGSAIGTPGYAAPEQFKGAAEPRSDIYSLGVLMHYLLTGRNPEGRAESTLFSFEQIKEINSHVPAYLDSLIMSMLDTVIDKRPRSAEAIRNMIAGGHRLYISDYLHAGVGGNEDEKYPNIFEAVKADDVNATADFIRKNPSLVNAKDRNGVTPLHWAIREGGRKAVQFLLSEGADVNVQDSFGRTPLGDASLRGQIDTAGFLIAGGADVNATNHRGETPLHEAALKGYREIAELLISTGADLNIGDIRGETPLHNAIAFGHVDVVELLISRGGDINARNSSDWTPLHWARAFCRKKIAELLESLGAGE
ncbi:MAG: ankyrin repeat domain-containing protein [Candidatus Xenobiia bacterium LiM19]